MRELNCQVAANPGGSAVRMPMLTSAVNLSARSGSSEAENASKCGEGSVTRNCSVRYSDFSIEQHPASSGFSELCSSWQLLSVGQARNSKPGRDSRRQCMVIDSEAKAASTNKMFPNDRTVLLISQSYAMLNQILNNLL